MSKYSDLTTEKKRQFFAYLADCWSPTRAAKAVGVSREMVFKHKEGDEAFAKRWADAIEQATDKLEDVAIERASTRSDTMLIFMLKAMRPQKYMEKNLLTVNSNVSISVTRAQEELKQIPREHLIESLALLEAPTIENSPADNGEAVAIVSEVE